MNKTQLNSGRPLSDYLKKHSFTSYLELGIFTKDTFEHINSIKRTGVDKDPKWSPTHLMTTDEFFAINDDRFELTYIDANHMIDFVVRDYNNSILVTDKVIAMHDMIPPTDEYTAPHYCGDSYKMLAYLIDHKDEHDFIVLNENYGVTFIFGPFKPIHLDDSYLSMSYGEFISKLNSISLLEKDEAEAIIDRKLNEKR